MRTWILAAVLLAGCSNVDKQLRAELDPMIGNDIRVPIAKLGYPTSQQTVLTETVYTWSLTPQTSGSAPCVLSIATDASGTIRHFSWLGDRRGCARFEEMMYR